MQSRNYPLYITHICSHTIFPGPLTQGNKEIEQILIKNVCGGCRIALASGADRDQKDPVLSFSAGPALDSYWNESADLTFEFKSESTFGSPVISWLDLCM